MKSQEIMVTSALGIHLRPAGAMSETALKFESAITFEYGSGKTANAKSVISILASGVKCGEKINLHADGVDEEDAIKAVSEAFIKSLNED